MAKKIKSDGSGIDEANRTMYAAFCNAANSLSQLYTQAESQQKLAFQAGERHSLEFNYIGEVPSMPRGYQWQQPQNLNSHWCHPNPTTQTDYSSVELSAGQTIRPPNMVCVQVFKNAVTHDHRESLIQDGTEEKLGLA
ncbi:hypothetical protein EJ110_NYTH04014 [Nymphaea thermarum]|nr:hypothetical protein EJ110_NYTH04014 [Nymphaea thermarum]